MRPNEERGGRHRHHGGGHHTKGPKTFRRGRAIAFLEILQLKRMTIKQQLDEPEFETIKSILIGELKALDMVINEFIQLFDLEESDEIVTTEDSSKESSEMIGDPADEINQ
ncbi:hypothetical protein [Rummeliibacillus sp. TYF-LIM-RU47]|uniref:hypothetical protein n=1 Tax=Rummeliibacillus sp. TYF-LIM-RU47 TaxID=2608406 RepID=UPI0012390D43|nr:hypothetical protein [Rummeliibacillus sp. TYF-LIM-RU47]